MRLKLICLLSIFWGFSFSTGLLWAESSREGVEVTVYNQNLGLVREKRKLELKKGIGEIQFTGVAAQIDATSVLFKSLTDPEGVTVLEQNFEYDLLNQQKLLQKYVDKEIVLERFYGEGMEKKERLKGVLLSVKGGNIVKIGGKIHVNPPGHFILPDLPEGLITRPTLVWKLQTQKGGRHLTELTYLTEGISWKSDYVLVTDKEDEHIDLTGWVTIDNKSGATYKDAKLKLIAGDVHRVAPQPRVRRMYAAMPLMSEAAAAPQFKEKSFFEYHLYTLQRPATVKDNQTKQIELVSAHEVPIQKLLIYDGSKGIYPGYYDHYRTEASYGTQTNKKVWVMLEFKNSKENHLGIPLPKGKMRVYKTDPEDQTLQFIGEDEIDHTPKDELVRIYLGDAFDVVGERIQTNFKINRNRFGKAESVEESFKISLHNHKDTSARVRVVEHMYRWSNWKIPQSSDEWTKKDAKTIEFEVSIAKDEEKIITYTVKYWW